MSKSKGPGLLETLVALSLLIIAIQKLLPDLITEIPEGGANSTPIVVTAEAGEIEKPAVKTYDSGVNGITYNFKNIEFIEIIPIDNSGYVIDPDQPTACAINPNWPSNIQRWCGWITQYSTQFGVDPDIIAAVMKQESNGNPEALGATCDTGLMQVMPSDGKLDGTLKTSRCDLDSGSVANYNTRFQSMFINRPTIAKLWVPQYNIFVGTQMVGASYSSNGSYRAALTGYNGSDTYPDHVFGHYQQYVGTPPK